MCVCVCVCLCVCVCVKLSPSLFPNVSVVNMYVPLCFLWKEMRTTFFEGSSIFFFFFKYDIQSNLNVTVECLNLSLESHTVKPVPREIINIRVTNQFLDICNLTVWPTAILICGQNKNDKARSRSPSHC